LKFLGDGVPVMRTKLLDEQSQLLVFAGPPVAAESRLKVCLIMISSHGLKNEQEEGRREGR